MSSETKVTTLRLEVDLLDDLDDEQDGRGYSNRTEYVRDILHRRDEIAWDDDSGDAAADPDPEPEPEPEPEPSTDPAPAPVGRAVPDDAAYEELLDRIDDLQRMLQVALARDAPDLEKRWQDDEVDAVEVQDEVHPSAIDSRIAEIDDPHIPGRGPPLKERKQAFADMYAKLYEKGRMSVAELKDEFYHDGLEYDDAYSWWTNCVVRRFDQLPGIRAPVDGGHYWFYDPEGVRWNREANTRPAQGVSAQQ